MHLPVKTALLVIDVQENLLIPSSKLHIDPTAIPEFIMNVNVAIKFAIDHDFPILYTVNEWTNPLLNALTGNACKKGAKGTRIDPRVRMAGDQIYRKSKMNAFSNARLPAYLKQNSIADLYITGLFAEACIKSTVRAAIKQGFKVWVIDDAVGSKNDIKHLRSMKACVKYGAALIKRKQLLENFSI